MVSLRLQRTGRRHLAMFRLVVQDSKFSPKSGRVIANLGFYNPHSKEHGIDLEKALYYLERGAQPSSRVLKILSQEKVKLPSWVKPLPKQQGKVRYPDKLRSNQEEEKEAKPQPESAQKESPQAKTQEKPQSQAENDSAKEHEQKDKEAK